MLRVASAQSWYTPFFATQPLSPDERMRFMLIVLLRAMFLGLMLSVLNEFVPLGTPPWILWMGSTAGLLIASYAARSALKDLGFLVILSLIALLHGVLAGSLNWLAPGTRLTPYALTLHSGLILGVFLISAAASWAFWRIRHTSSVEAIVIALGCVGIFSGHRDYRFDTPQIITDIAWSLRVEPLTVLVIGGIGTVILTVLYLYVAVLPGQLLSTHERRRRHSFHALKPNYRDGIIFSAVIIGLVAFVSRELYLYYHQISETRIANGVGEESSEGLSPLTFHSALGSTNQPSGLVRLEGDYKENPHSPMLYLRTSALSHLKGNQLVIGPSYLDRDIANTTPHESYNGVDDAALDQRKPVTQSIYLLAEHNTVFTIDFPTSIRPLKNPNPGRFRGAYRAVSLAPTYSIKDLQHAEVGDPRWTPAVRQHYLETHADPRYGALAQKIAGGAVKPLEMVNAITQYLSKTAIYTLAPGHEVKADEDPVAPFLFGDYRGYCVHFAHSLVYMFRSLGIPSRIGTGYLTDLSESKDGHILLRMSDRHAWSEVYIKGKGWVPFDIQPDQVESHAGSDVDLKLLEELMGILGPGEEILPEAILDNEANVEPLEPLLTPQLFLGVAIAVLLFSILWKIYLRWGWLLPGSPEYKLRTSYRAVLSKLLDVGYARRRGETKGEYKKRLFMEEGLNTLSLVELMNFAAYSRHGGDSVDVFEIQERHARDVLALRSLPWWRRVVALISPRSLVASLGGVL